MKTILLFFAATITLLSAKAQFSQNFDSGTSGLSGNCWTFNQVNWTNTPGEVITGTGSLYSLPHVNSSGNDYFSTPVLNITSTSFTVSFNYQLTGKLSGAATRTIQIGLLDVNNNFTLLTTITLDKFTPLGIQTFNQTFTLSSIGLFKLDIAWAGDHGDGSSRLVFDDLYTNASARYGSGTCNSAPIAVNDVFSHVCKQRLNRFETFFIAANHDGKRGVACADVAAADRRVKERRAALGELFGHLARLRR